MSDFEVVREYLHDGDGKQYPDAIEALSRIEADRDRRRVLEIRVLNVLDQMETVAPLDDTVAGLASALRQALEGSEEKV